VITVNLIGIILLSCFFQFNCSRSPGENFEKFVPDSITVQYLGKDSIPMYLPGDLKIELWAESPMFYNPTNMDVDHRGRIWITEAVNYRDYNAKKDQRMHHPEGDRVMILEDTNYDGRADLSKVFVQDTDLVSPLGIAVIGNQVIVSCSPRMIIYTDTTGDDVADTKEIVLEGFGGLDHDHSLHSVFGGPDGNWYFNVGNAGPHIVRDKSGWELRSGSMYTGGSPYNKENQGRMKSDDGEVWTGGLALRMNNKGEKLSVYAHNFRNCYEIAMDSYGTMWQNDNDDQMMACRTSYVMEYGNAGYFSEDGTRSWQGDRRPGQDIFTAHWHQEDPGVMPAGDNTGAGSPTGIVVNEGDGLGKKYRGVLWSAEAGKNVIYGYKPQPYKAGYLFERHNLISSIGNANTNYKWSEDTLDKRMSFRPSDVCIGVDGALYVADWYDPIVGGHMMRELKGYGRIYKISSKSIKPLQPKIEFNTLEGLIEAFKSPAVNIRYHALERLKDSGEIIIPRILPLLKDDNEYIRMRTIWLLAQSGQAGIQKTVKILEEGKPSARVVAFRALKHADPERVLDYCRSGLTTNNHSLYREILIALKPVPYSQCSMLLDTLINRFDGEDPYFLAAFASACKHKEDSVYLGLLKNQLDNGPWNKKQAGLVHALHPLSAVSDIIYQINSSGSSEVSFGLLNTLAFIRDTQAVHAMFNLSQSEDSILAPMALWWLGFRRTNDWQDLVDFSQYDSLITSPEVRKMNHWMDAITKTKGKHQLKIALEMAADPAGGLALLQLLTNDKLDPAIRRPVQDTLFSNPNPLVRAMAGDMFWRKNKQYSIDVIKRMDMNKDSGLVVFNKACISCHRVGQRGGLVGPDLTDIGQKMDMATLLDAIVNPGAGVAFGFETYSIETKDGKSLNGFLLNEGPVVRIKDILGQIHELPSTSIRKMKLNTSSLMPAPQTLNLRDVDIAHVVAYLKNK